MMNENKVDAAQCSICSALKDQEYAYQKYGSADGDTELPAAVATLVLVRDLRPHGSRRLELQRCPLCNTHYLYRTDYEYLVNGSEDEQFLTRLSGDQVKEYLDQPVGD